jgi:putative tricarboxylic transport membrane protein
MEKRIFGSERITHLVIALASIVIMILSLSYGLGTVAKPGPGMYPFVVGLFILGLSLSLFVSCLRRETKEAIFERGQIGIFVLFVVSCCFWILAMPYLGYPLATLVATFFIAKIMKLEGWIKPFLISAGTALFIYLLFDCWLYIDLPRGIWG